MKFRIHTFTLKMIAVLAMLLDHIGAVFLPAGSTLYLVFRVIGRLAFPIFAYTLVEGFFYTHDIKKYGMRMGIAALVSEIPFDLAFFGRPFCFQSQNVFFTLCLGLLMMHLLAGTPSVWKRLLYLGCLFLAAILLRVDYSWMGLLMILWLYRFRNEPLIKMASLIAINVFLAGGLQKFAAFAVIPIALHGREQGPKWKWFFYGFYPLHLLVIGILRMIL